MKISICKLACAAVILSAPLAQAAPITVWDNGGPALSTQGGSLMSSFLQAANFTTGFATNLSSASFWSLEVSEAYANSITYSILGNDGGSPDEAIVLASSSVTPTRTPLGATELGGIVYGIFQYDFDLAVNDLAAGTYWLALHNGALSTAANEADFYWAWSDPNATNGGLLDDQERELFPLLDLTWRTNQAEHAFLIAGERVGEQPISEPGTLLLATLAAGLGLTSSRRRKTA